MDQVALTIDGKKIKTIAGKTVLEAAGDNGIYIPTLCYLKKLSPIGSCRICLVEVEGAESPMASCQLPVREGMVVVTQSEKLTAVRQMMVKLMLQNHPLDCPVCERSGECRLQNLTCELNVASLDFKAEPVSRTKRDDWGLVKYNPYLCILCERCVRVCHEVQGVSAFKINDKGYKSFIDTVDGKPLACEFCGQCISACPVGALSSGLVLQARSWDFDKIKTTCPFCATGCTLLLDIKKGNVYRVSSDDSIGINNGNLCAKGRFGYQFIYSDERLKTPLIKKGGTFVPASWGEAINLVAGKFQEIIKHQGAQAIAGIGSERLPNEDNYLLHKFFTHALGSSNIDTIAHLENSAFENTLLDGFRLRVINSTDAIGKSDLIFAFGVDPAKENPVMGNIVRKAMRDAGTSLIACASRDVRFRPHPGQKIIYRYGSEIGLLSGIIKILAQARAKDPEFMSAGGFKALLQAVKDVNLAEAASACGVQKELIEKAALQLAKAVSPVILCGIEISRHPFGADILHALSDLARLMKSPVLLYREYCNSQGQSDMVIYSRDSENIIDKALAGKIKAFYVMGEDPLVNCRNGHDIKKAFEKTEFVVVQDMFLTQTAKAANVVFPSVSFAERDGTFTNMEGRVQKINKAIHPQGESRADWEIINEIGAKMKWGFNYQNAEEIFKEISDTIPSYKGLCYLDLEKNGLLTEYSRSADFNEPAFQSDKYLRKSEMMVSDKEKEEGQFTLLTGNDFFHLGTLSRKSAALNALAWQCHIDINPLDAETLGIKDGDAVTIESKQASIGASARISREVSPKTVFIPKGFENSPVNSLTGKKDALTLVKITKKS